MEQKLISLSKAISYLTPVGPTDRPILMSVSGDRHTLMIDGGNSEAHAKLFLEKLHEAGKPQPTLAAVTHWHWDHVFGLSALSVPVISSVDTRREMEKLAVYSWDDAALDQRVNEGIEIPFCANAIREEFPGERDMTIVLPDITFEDELTIDLGGLTCVLKQVGGDHAPDGIVVYIKEERVLFLADAIVPDLYAPSWRFTARETLSLLDKIEAFDAQTYVISHWKAITRQEYVKEADLLRTLAFLVSEHEGDLDHILKELEAHKGEPLEMEEAETADYFVNGYRD
ncbi:Zn-dependent hydrolase [Alteribacter lacisalsi]|uniref:Zn-dependent hydrolase n=1 Tax=Alteribacter lacisalsi TaxID=2045244 RepID=A0A2W0H908_9BACI|nr:MBL fold metallo-hydrolase [Alteribacter lacisalsi]PYZ97637.1 Zn-dependent hydrolase [Alteribacter lacisalsi]